MTLSQKLQRTTYVIDVYQGDEKYSSGSGYCIHDQGFLATAAHVITNRLPIRKEDWRDPEVRITARTAHGEPIEYEPVLCGIDVSFPGPLKDALQVDVALLRPTESRTGVEHLEVSNSRWPVGTQVLMAGFPDEMEAPLRWTDAINRYHEGFKDTPEETEKKVERVNQLLMVKTGMIGYSDSLVLDPDGSNERTLDVGFYYVDNVMHSGSSGGPVVNLLGQALGIISKRAVTRVSYPDLANPNKEVPSGSALAVAAYTLIDAINEWSTVDG